MTLSTTLLFALASFAVGLGWWAITRRADAAGKAVDFFQNLVFYGILLGAVLAALRFS